ncbi:HEPN domain-containing protein [Candidatus Micrarchaeota archaeon]|nr:HEPN domain-containing protein [Candidatus Micrarchaeota archaeon]
MQDNNRTAFEKWFSQSEYDLKAAKRSMAQNDYEWACFQSQQSAEKALKAYLMLKGKRDLMTHSVYALLKEATANEKTLEKCMDCKALDQYYISTRYPEGLPDGIPHDFYKEGDAKKCISYAGRLLSAIRGLTRK